MNKPQIRTNIIDRAVEFVSPVAAARRYKNRVNIQKFKNAGYVVPGSSKRSMKGINASSNSPDNDTLPKVNGSRALSRDMYMNTPNMAALLRRARTNIVGPGLMLQSRIDRDFLGLTEEQARAWQKNIEREFDLFANSLNASFNGNMNFWESQGLAALSPLMNGDMFFMLPWKKPKGPKNWPYELRIKLIEADLVVDPNNINGSNYVRNLTTTESTPLTSTTRKDTAGGVELDKKTGEVIAFHVASKYPRDFSQIKKDEIKRVPIYNRNKDRQIWQIIDTERIGQRRGMPWAAPILDGMKQISRLTEAELMHAIVSSFFTVLIKDNSNLNSKLQQGFTPEESISGGGYGPDDNPQETRDDANSWDLEMGYGNINYLDEDQEAQILDPEKTDKTFADFSQEVSTQLSAACEVPVEQVRLMFTSSYTAARAALLEGFKMWKTKRFWLARRYCQPVYEEFVTESVLKGRINAPGFFDDPLIRAAWCKAAWVGQGMGQLNPYVETKAADLKIEKNLSNHEDEYMMMNGGRWDEAMEKKSSEEIFLEELGLNQVIEQPIVNNTGEGNND